MKDDGLFLSVNTTSSSPFQHFLYVKKHKSKKGETKLPNDRTAFVSNLPVGCTVKSLKSFFSNFGEIESVNLDRLLDSIDHEDTNSSVSKLNFDVLQELSTSQKPHDVISNGFYAHVVFKEEEGLEKLLEYNNELPFRFESEAKMGLQKYKKRCTDNYPNRDELQRKVDKYMASYDQKKKEEWEKLKESHNQPDEDGFVTVTRYHRRNKNKNEGATITAAKESAVKGLKTKKKELIDFYRFQMRQAKREQLADLRKKFEEDKRKIERMKAARRFRPY